MKSLILFIVLFLALLAGCAPTIPPGTEIKTSSTYSSDFHELTPGLGLFALVGIASIAAAVVIGFLAPAQHNLSLAIGAGGVTLTVLAIFVHAALGIIVWIVGGLFVLAIIFAVYEVWRNRKALATDVGGVIPPGLQQSIPADRRRAAIALAKELPALGNSGRWRVKQ